MDTAFDWSMMPIPGPTLPPSAAHDVSVRLLDPATASVSVNGTLDQLAVQEVGRAMERARASHLERLVLDLSSVTDFTPEAPAALHARCRQMTTLPRGMAMQAGSGAGRQALLATLLAAPEPSESREPGETIG